MTQRFPAKLLTRLGFVLFGFLSMCEEKKLLPKTARWLKLSLLGLGVTLLAACVKKPDIDQTRVTCYEPVAVYPQVTELLIKPNPTNGADSVTVTAKAQVVNASGLDQIITSAQCIVEGDTTAMKAQDGAFDDSYEDLISWIYISGFKNDSVEVKVKANSNYSGWDEQSTFIKITDK